MKKIIVSIILMGFLFTMSIACVSVFGTKGIQVEQEYQFHAIPYANIYVDDSNTQGPWNGTLEHPYQYVQDGINASNNGDTVFVFNGIYTINSSTYIRKSIRLVGENKYNTIIDAPCLKVYEVNGFELRNFCLGWSDPNIALFDCSHCIISGNTIPLTSTHGILLSGSSNCTVSDNFIHCSGGTCIYVKGSNNEIKDNYLSGSNYADRGIEIRLGSNDTVVANNTICNFGGNGMNGGDGIYLDTGCNRVRITGNIINNIVGNGLNLHSSNLTISRNKITNSSYGISLSRTDDVFVSDNIIKNTETGIELVSDTNYNIVISGNIIDNAELDGITLFDVVNSVLTNNTIKNVFGYGIYVVTVKNILISDNNINNCYYGINLSNSNYLDQLDPIITIKNNMVSYNYYGIALYGTTFFNVITKNEIRNNVFGVMLASNIKAIRFPFENWIVANNISENYYGVYATILTSSNHIYYNNFINNTQNAFDKGTNIWYKYKLLGQSMGNYWDDYTGSDNNGDGIGDSPYDVPPLPFRNKDRYPCMEPIDIGNIASSYSELIQSNSQPSTQPSSQPISKTATQTTIGSTTLLGKTASK